MKFSLTSGPAWHVPIIYQWHTLSCRLRTHTHTHTPTHTPRLMCMQLNTLLKDCGPRDPVIDRTDKYACMEKPYCVSKKQIRLIGIIGTLERIENCSGENLNNDVWQQIFKDPLYQSCSSIINYLTYPDTHTHTQLSALPKKHNLLPHKERKSENPLTNPMIVGLAGN